MAFKDWSTTAADNDDADSDINWAEGQAPSTVNGSARQMMAKLKTALGHIINVKDYGAVGDGVTDDTTALQTALTACAGSPHGGTLDVEIDASATTGKRLHLPAGVYISGPLTGVHGVDFYGDGAGSIIKLKDNSNADLLTFTAKQGWSIRHMVLDGNKANQTSGSCLKLNNNTGGGWLWEGFLSNLRIQNAKTSGIATTGNAYGNHLFAQDVLISLCDQYGADLDFLNDSRFTGTLDIRFCLVGALRLAPQAKNLHFSTVKVWGCRADYTLGWSVDKVIPVSATLAADTGAVIVRGAGHVFNNIELQENGSMGIRLGDAQYSAAGISIRNIMADGNGGYDPGAAAPDQAAYRRYGILLTNYYNVQIRGVCDDFRARRNKGRQSKGLHCVSTPPTFTSSSTLIADNWYKITDNSGGADFTNIQLGLASTSNDVGTVFQARTADGSTPVPTDWGTGELSAVNDRLSVDLVVINQYEQDQGTGDGYTIAGDGGHSLVEINGEVIATPFVRFTNKVSSNANTLDWYEEGTSTITVKGTSTDGTASYSSQTLRWTRIGNRVLYTGTITYTGHTGTGNVKLSGFPYSATTSGGNINLGSVYSVSGLAITAGWAGAYIQGTDMFLRQVSLAGAGSGIPIAAAQNFTVAGQYEVA